MAKFNLVVLAGNLTRDCESRSVGDKTVYKTGLAVNGWKEGDVMFIDLTAWNKTGEALAKVRKGQTVQVRGRLKLETWDDKNGGGKRSKHSIDVDEVIYLGGKDTTTTTEAPQANEPEAETPSSGIPF